jgi:hypothetical protein
MMFLGKEHRSTRSSREPKEVGHRHERITRNRNLSHLLTPALLPRLPPSRTLGCPPHLLQHLPGALLSVDRVGTVQ